MRRIVPLLLLLLCWTSQAWAATRYVSPGGGGTACAETNPCSADTGQSQTQPGDTLLFRGGDYGSLRIGSDHTLRGGTSASNQTTFASYPGELATVGVIVVASYGGPTYQYITFDRFHLNCAGSENAIFIGTSSIGTSGGNAAVHHITVKNTEAHNCPASCIHAVNATDVTFTNMHAHHCGTNRLDHSFYTCGKRMIIEDSDVHDSSGYGLQIYYHDDSGDRTCNDDTIIRRNRIHDLYSTDTAVTLDQGSRILFYNNLVYNNTAGIRSICQDAYGTQIFNNTFYGLNDKAIDLCGTPNVQNTQIKNNIIANSGSAVAIAAGATGTVTSNNLCYSVSGSTFGCDHSGDPAFNNAGLADFRITTGSAAKNQGTTLANVPDDASSPRVARPSGSAYDIGAYEFDEGGGPPPPTGPTVRYMAPGGSDGNSCEASKNTATPKQNFSSAIPCMAAGDTLQLRGGTYNQRLQPTSYSSHPNGTDYGAGAVTVMGYPGETAILTQVVDFSWDSGLHHWILKDFTIDGTAVAQATGDSGAFWAGQGVHHIRLDNLTIQRQLGGWIGIAISGQASDLIEIINSRISGFEYGFYMRGTNWLVDKNEIFNNEGYGVHVYDSGSTIVSGNIISNNYVHDNGQSLAHGTLSAGIVISHGTDNRAINNIVTGQGVQGNCLAGIQVGNQSTNSKVYNNTIVDNGACPGISINAGDPVGTDIQNNLIFNNTGGQIQNNGVSFTSGKNLCGASGTGCELVTSDPKLTNTGSGAARYKLQTTEPRSPAIDAGNALAAVPTDIAGVSRPQPSDGSYDIGAYEAPAGGGRVSPGTFWVSSSGGVDPPTRTCGAALNNINAPLLTFNAGRACLTVSGDKLFLRAGSYEGSMSTQTQPIASGTDWANATTIAGYGTEVATLSLPSTSDVAMYFNASNQFIVLDRLILDCHNQTNSNGLAMTTGTHHIRFQNGEIRNCHFEPVYIENSDNNEILSSNIHGSAIKDCIGLTAGSDNTILRSNTIHMCAGAGIIAGNPNTGTVIRNNQIRNVGTTGIALFSLTSPEVINNVVYSNNLGIQLFSGTSNAKVYNNTVYGNTTDGIRMDTDVTGTLLTNNISASNSGVQIVGPATQLTNLTTAPPFAGASAGDFHLTSASTTAIDMGTPLTTDVPTDYEGVPRPQRTGYDIGASEFQSTETLPGVAIRQPYWKGQGFFWR